MHRPYEHNLQFRTKPRGIVQQNLNKFIKRHICILSTDKQWYLFVCCNSQGWYASALKLLSQILVHTINKFDKSSQKHHFQWIVSISELWREKKNEWNIYCNAFDDLKTTRREMIWFPILADLWSIKWNIHWTKYRLMLMHAVAKLYFLCIISLLSLWFF